MRLIKCLASLILMAINLIGCSSRDSHQRDHPYTRSDSIAFYQDEIHKISKQQGHHHFELDYIQADTVQMDLLLQAYKDIKERLEDRLGFLNSIDEPDFSLLMDSIETYRLVYSFAFESGKYILVRVAATNDTYSLLMKEIAVLPGYDPEIGDSIWIPIITSEFHKGLSMEEWFQFKRLLSDSYFFGLSSSYPDVGFDGYWFDLEGTNPSNMESGLPTLHKVSRWAPGDNSFGQACYYLLTLAGVKPYHIDY